MAFFQDIIVLFIIVIRSPVPALLSLGGKHPFPCSGREGRRRRRRRVVIGKPSIKDYKPPGAFDLMAPSEGEKC